MSKTVLHPTCAYIMICKGTELFSKEKDLAGIYHVYRLASEIQKEEQSTVFQLFQCVITKHEWKSLRTWQVCNWKQVLGWW